MNLTLQLSSVLSFAILLTGCGPMIQFSGPVPKTPIFQEPEFQESLPFREPPFNMLADDIDRDGRTDIVVISHGGNYAQVFFQKKGREFVSSREIFAAGFHPGDVISWRFDAQSLYLLAAEGENQVIALEFDPENGLREVRRLSERVPRHLASFRWPRWGNSLAVAPFDHNHLVLLRDFDPGRRHVADRVSIPLSSHPNSLRQAERIAVADIDGDGADELLFASSLTNELFVLRHPGGDELPTPELIRKFSAGAANQVALADLDGNGAQDLIVPNQTEPFRIQILLNDGRGNFSDASSLSFPTTMGLRQVAAETDGDGMNYVLAVGYGSIALYRFPARWDGRMTVPMRSVPMGRSEGCQALLLKDIDGDGWLDGILGRGVGGKGAWIVYGPLWKHFDELAAIQFKLI